MKPLIAVPPPPSEGLLRRTADAPFSPFLLAAALVAASLIACAGQEPEDAGIEPAAEEARRPDPNPLRNAYFGDLHVHTKHSFDAYLMGARETPDAAYRFAKGETISHPSGYDIRLESGPLDFQGVTDHAFYMGLVPAMNDPETDVYDAPLSTELRELGPRGSFNRALDAVADGEFDELDSPEIRRSAWEDVIAAAERHNDPGTFTTFIGYEYTASTADMGNLHRNVIFRGSEVPELPFTRNDSIDPEDLWTWLDDQRAAGMDALAIPHNSNGSNGEMFKLARFDDSPMDAAYAEKRMRNEPIVELTQIKGTSEVHPLLNPNDEWANFEIMPFRVATQIPSEPDGSYVRQALGRGLALQDEQGFNPFRFGFIGSSDTHNAGGNVEEDDYHGKVGLADGTPQSRGSVPLDEPREDGSAYAAHQGFPTFGAAGLAGVWAEENTRESLFEAMRRKETFATSGPRIKVRFFAGYDYEGALVDDPQMLEKAYAGGVPMGGDLFRSADEEAAPPSFILWAVRDPDSAPLQRLQIVKVWSEDNSYNEQVIDVACSDGLAPDPNTNRCPDNGASVNLSDCSISADLGAAELRTVWTDPDFDPERRALYYLRVLENPTCRWSTWDALRAGVEPREGLARTIQERAWSSPIWFVP